MTPRTLLRWLRAGRLPGVQTAGGHWRVAPADIARFMAHQEGGGIAVVPTGGPRIVVVEDDREHAVALERVIRLCRPRATIHLAQDGLAAGLLLGTQVPDVAFVDIELPGLDGLEVIRRALAIPTLAAVRFVVVSGALSDTRTAELTRLGVRHVLPKPVTPPQVRDALEELLDGSAWSADASDPLERHA